MKIIRYAQTQNDITTQNAEYILGHKDFSRFGKLNSSEFQALTKKIREKNGRVIFEWDILMTQDSFEQTLGLFKEFDDNLIDEYRVQDPGALNYILENKTKKIQLIAETGNHNLIGLKSWESLIGDRLSRIIVSNELSREKILSYQVQLNTPLEILIFGRILLFYTPRNLLSPLYFDHEDADTRKQLQIIEGLGTSEESPHRGFPLIENKHGTFMFYIKELCLLDDVLMAEEFSNLYGRVDLRWVGPDDAKTLNELIWKFEESKYKEFKQNYPTHLIKGFFKINKTDVLFKKLKNKNLKHKDEAFIGEVLAAEKDSYVAIELKGHTGLKVNDEISVQMADGRIVHKKVKRLRNNDLEHCDEIVAGELAIIDFVKGCQSRAQVYKV